MRKITKSLLCFILFIMIGQNASLSQQVNQVIKTIDTVVNNKSVKDHFIFVGGGALLSTNTLKEMAHLYNMPAFSINTFLPIKQAPCVSWGIDGGVTYSFTNNMGSSSTTPYQVQDQISAPNIKTAATGSPVSQSFKIEAGPSAMIRNNKSFRINPGITLAYLNNRYRGLVTTQTSFLPDTAYNFNLFTQQEVTSSGIGVVPKIRLLNMFGNIGIWVEANYTIGPKINTTSVIFQPEGSPNTDGAYNIQQLRKPTYTTVINSISYHAVGISGGIVIGVGQSRKRKLTGNGPQSTDLLTVKEFTNGCTRTCTGDWSYNSSTDLYTCGGTAGPLICGSALGESTVLSGNRSAAFQTFGKDGAIATGAGQSPKKKLTGSGPQSTDVIKEFSNGCTRTCTGTWSYNPSTDLYYCSGTAGALTCGPGMGNSAVITGGKSSAFQTFDKDGAIATGAGQSPKKKLTGNGPQSSDVIKEFSNGCTRTCTGTWSYNPSTDLYYCSGTAGALTCGPGMGNSAVITGGRSSAFQIFNKDGSIHTEDHPK